MMVALVIALIALSIAMFIMTGLFSLTLTYANTLKIKLAKSKEKRERDRRPEYRYSYSNYSDWKKTNR